MKKKATPRGKLSYPAWLLERTFAVQYNPNCPSPFLVRLVHPRRGALDNLPYRGVGNCDITQDILGFGTTMRKAAMNARFNQWAIEAELEAELRAG